MPLISLRKGPVLLLRSRYSPEEEVFRSYAFTTSILQSDPYCKAHGQNSAIIIHTETHSGLQTTTQSFVQRETIKELESCQSILQELYHLIYFT